MTKFQKITVVLIIALAFLALAGTVFAEAGQPITKHLPFFDVPISFEGDFNLNTDGTGTCSGSFAVDPAIWAEFRAGADWDGSIWTGLGEVFDGPYLDEDDEPAYTGMWDFFTHMKSHYPWPWTH